MIPNSEVYLFKGIPLFKGEPHQLTFNNLTEQFNYFFNKRSTSMSFKNLTTIKEDRFRIELNYELAKTLNYIQFRNNNFATKWFYAFITKVEYVNTRVCEIHYELDHFQTWYFDFQYQPSYIERAHVRRFNSDGSPIVNTVDEGLNYGTDYEVVSMEQYKPYGDFLFLVAVCKEQMHSDTNGDHTGKIKGSWVGTPQPLSYYILPFNTNLTNVSYMIGSQSIAPSKPTDFLTSLFTQEGAVDNVVSIYITEVFCNDVELVSEGTLRFNETNFIKGEIADGNNLNATCIHVKDISDFGVSASKTIGNKYVGFTPSSESKLYMYPYSFTELTDLKGNTFALKNEYIAGNDLTIQVFSGIAPNPKVIYKPLNYKQKASIGNNKVNFDESLVSDSPNDLPILVDTISAYFQGQRNQLENTKAQTIFNTVTSIGTGALGGLMMGGGVGSAIGAVGGAVSGIGNTYYSIEGMNAKQKDIVNTPPQLAKLGGNTAFDFGNRIYGLWIVKKQPTPENRARLEKFWKMYGYRVNDIRPIQLKSRENFNFIKTVDLMVKGDVPQDSIQAVKELFNNGVTLWHNVNNIFNYGVANDEV